MKSIAMAVLSVCLCAAAVAEDFPDSAVFVGKDSSIKIRRCAGTTSDGKIKIRKPDNAFELIEVPAEQIDCWTWLNYAKCKATPLESITAAKAVLAKMADEIPEKKKVAALITQLEPAAAWVEKTKGAVDEKEMRKLLEEFKSLSEKENSLTDAQYKSALAALHEKINGKTILLKMKILNADTVKNGLTMLDVSAGEDDFLIVMQRQKCKINIPVESIGKGKTYIVLAKIATSECCSTMYLKINAADGAQIDLYEKTPLE